VTGVELADADQRLTLDPAQVAEYVEPLHALEPMRVQLPVHLLCVVGHPVAKEPPAAVPLLLGGVVATVGALGDRGDLVTPGPAEAFYDPGEVEAGHCGLEHKRARVAGVTNGVGQRDHRTERVPVDHRADDPDRIAEVADGVGARLETPLFGLAPVGAAVSRQVEVDDLR
jgi:hypothetical protein